MRRTLLSICIWVAISQGAPAQQSAIVPVEFQAYTTCHFADGLQTVQVDPLGQEVTARTVDTANGTKRIDLLSGERVMFAYPDSDFYANVKVERLPEKDYPQLRKILLENLEFILQSDATNKRSAPASINGLDVYGLDRAKLEGGVLGFYLLLDDKRQTTTTIYFLNEDPHRKFKTIEEYATLRDDFLKSYTACIHSNRP